MVLAAADGRRRASACGTWRGLLEAVAGPGRARRAAAHRQGAARRRVRATTRPTFDAGTFKTSLWDPGDRTRSARSRRRGTRSAPGTRSCPTGGCSSPAGTTGVPDASTNDSFAGSRKAFVFDPATSRVRGRARHARSPAGTRRWSSSATAGSSRSAASTRTASAPATARSSTAPRGPTPTPPPAADRRRSCRPTRRCTSSRDGRLFYSGANVSARHDAARASGTSTRTRYQKVAGLPKTGTARRGDERAAPARAGPAGDDPRRRRTNAARRPPTDSTAIVDLKQPIPKYAARPPMDAAKIYVSAVILPGLDGAADRRRARQSVERRQRPGVQRADLRPEDGHVDARPRHPRCRACTTRPRCCCPTAGSRRSAGTRRARSRCASRSTRPPYLEKDTPRPADHERADRDDATAAATRFGTTQASPLTSAVLVRPAAVTHSSRQQPAARRPRPDHDRERDRRHGAERTRTSRRRAGT